MTEPRTITLELIDAEGDRCVVECHRGRKFRVKWLDRDWKIKLYDWVEQRPYWTNEDNCRPLVPIIDATFKELEDDA